MENQSSNQLTSSEEIYSKMIQDTFGISEIFAETVEESKINDFSIDSSSDPSSIDDKLTQKIINIFTAELQEFLPGAFRIIPQQNQCLSYANLQSWSPGRSYFSMFEMNQSKSIWFLHLSRSVGEGLAALSHSRNSRNYRSVYQGMHDADSVIFLETAEILRRIFKSLLEIWPASEKLKFIKCRHILHLGFLKENEKQEKYLILPFFLDNKVCTGEINLVLPQIYLNKLIL